MPIVKPAVAAALLAACALPALAASSTSSAASDSASTSVGSLSTSFEKSSDSSTGGKQKTAGDYRVIEVADAPARPGIVRMKLAALAGGAAEGEFYLYLPRQAAADSRVETGQIVSAREHAYGLEFARADTRQAFYLVLNDAALRELQTSVVAL